MALIRGSVGDYVIWHNWCQAVSSGKSGWPSYSEMYIWFHAGNYNACADIG
jgi:hypothetical protein